MSSIKILLWDIDGTVLNFDAAERAAIRKGFETMGLGECTDEMLTDYNGINKKYWQKLERGEMTKPEILTGRFFEFFTKYGVDTSAVEAFNKQYQLDLGDTICFNDNAFELICSLRGKYSQYAVSNGTKTAQRKKLRLSGLEDVFDGVFISDEVGFEKPAKEFFDRVFAAVKEHVGEFTPDEVLMIGDSLTSDVTGGNNAGTKVCWYNPEHQKKPDGLRIDFDIDDLNSVTEIMK